MNPTFQVMHDTQNVTLTYPWGMFGRLLRAELIIGRAEDQRAELNVHFHRAGRKMMSSKMEKNAKGAKRSAKS